MKPFTLAMITTALVGTLTMPGAKAQIHYPATRTVDVHDDYFGTRVNDPYRWLEDDNSPETAAWVEAQNALTHSFLNKIPFRQRLLNRLSAVRNYATRSTSWREGDKYYFYTNNGLQNQNVLCCADTPDGEGTVVLDPNTLSTDGTVALQNISFSADKKYMAYVISRSGSDWNEIYVMDAKTGKLLDDHIVWAKFTNATWWRDGFFYSAYDAPKEGESALSGVNEYHKVYYHKIGTQQADDELVFRSFTEPLLFFMAGVSHDERFIYISESDGDGYALYVKDTKAAQPRFIKVKDGYKGSIIPITNTDEKLYFTTDVNAPKSKVVTMDIANLAEGKTTDLIPESDYPLTACSRSADKLIVSYEMDACTRLFVYDMKGTRLREITLPGPGTASFSCSEKYPEAFVSFTSYTTPNTLYRLDVNTGKLAQYWAPKVAFDTKQLVTEQVFYTSKDGTRVPMFIMYKKGLKRNGKNPTLLYGYGGFAISLTPSLSTSRIPFLENGGVYVVANIRGGAEYGEEWHLAGTKLHKQNVFDDFIAAAEYLIEQKFTCPDRLAICGGSNGGLLIGAVVNQRPDLFRVAVPQVGVMDMLRYHLFTIGWNWAADYGRSDDSPEMFKYLYGYSPLHNVKNDGTRYPAIMVTTGDHDDRVVPAHSFKYAATLQASNVGPLPRLIRIDTKAGHGGGKPVAKVLEEQADIYSFILYNMGLSFK